MVMGSGQGRGGGVVEWVDACQACMQHTGVVGHESWEGGARGARGEGGGGTIYWWMWEPVCVS